MSLIHIINSYALSQPNNTAHIYRENSITYKELKEKSDALASYIISKFGKDKTPILVYGHKENEMLISFLACVKAGHAYMPVDTSFPKQRINDIIENSKTNLILNISSNVLESKDKINIVSLSDLVKIFQEYKDTEPSEEYAVKGDEVYYIIYTSGSTGKPKGVQIPLSALESFVKWGLSLSGYDANNVYMNQAPFSFDLSVMDLYLALASGATLFSIDKMMISNLKELFKYLSISNITTWVSTPSFAEMCLADSSFNRDLVPSLKTMLFCGEVLSNNCVERLHNRFNEVKVVNTYGPTEATVAITSVVVDEALNNNIIPLPVGKVKDGCKLLIIDKEGRELPEGKNGEILIVGDSVSLGYHNNSKMTEKAFLKVEIDNRIQRAYKTGDEGYLKDGMLYYLGRIDFQIKLNGFRMEVEDIENNLRKIDMIENVVILPVTREGKLHHLAAVVTLNKREEKKDYKIAVMIKNDLKKLLPEYMIPRNIIIKDTLPMNPNGKVNRKLLMEEMQ